MANKKSRSYSLLLMVLVAGGLFCAKGMSLNDGTGSGSGSSDTTAPTTPGTFTATVVSATQIDLSWTASTDNVTAQSALVYQICQAAATGGCNTFTAAYTTNAGVVAYSVTGLSASTSYFFMIKAKDAAGNTSSASSEATGTTSPIFIKAASFDGASDVRHLFTAQSSTTIYTIELRFKANGATANQRLVALSSSGNVTFAEIFFSAGGVISANYATAACSTGLLTGGTVPTAGTKYHVALVSNGGSGGTLYLNGVQEATAATPVVNCATWAFNRVGASATGTGQFNGTIDDLRISSIARYTTGFTPGSTPLTNDANTFLLQNFDSSVTTVTNTNLSGMSYATVGTPALITSPFP